MGHFDQFPATYPSVGYLFGQETVAGATPDGRSAPTADLPAVTPEREGSTEAVRKLARSICA